MCLQEKKVVRFSRSLILHFLEFTREEYCSGLPFPSSRILLTQGSNLPLLHCDMWSVSHWALWEAHFLFIYPFINAKSWASLKLNIQKTEIMASGPITSWQIDGEIVETVSDFNFGGSKITADGDCSHKIKRRLLLGRKVMTNLNSILKSRDITLPTKVCPVKALVFPAVMYGCESWTVKKAEHWRIDAFELWCWRRLLRVPWTARRSVLGVYWKDWCWSWNSSTSATSCEELTHWKRSWCWEGLGSGGEGGNRGWDGWMASPSWWTWVWVNSRSWWWPGRPGMLWFRGCKELDMTERLNWTELTEWLSWSRICL